MLSKSALTTMNDYQRFVESRAKKLPTVLEDILHGAVGVSGEAGELLDSVKKSWVYGKPVDYKNIVEECGDLLFYIQLILNQTDGETFQSLMESNMEKLRHCIHPDISSAAAIARADKQSGD